MTCSRPEQLSSMYVLKLSMCIQITPTAPRALQCLSFQYYLIRIFRSLICAYQKQTLFSAHIPERFQWIFDKIIISRQDFNEIFGKISRFQWDFFISRFRDFTEISKGFQTKCTRFRATSRREYHFSALYNIAHAC